MGDSLRDRINRAKDGECIPVTEAEMREAVNVAPNRGVHIAGESGGGLIKLWLCKLFGHAPHDEDYYGSTPEGGYACLTVTSCKRCGRGLKKSAIEISPNTVNFLRDIARLMRLYG